jgi:hypothetical protein
MSALTTHIVTNLEKIEKKKETNQNLRQVIKCQTKGKARSLERYNLDPLRQGQRLDTTEIKCSKIVASSR